MSADSNECLLVLNPTIDQVGPLMGKLKGSNPCADASRKQLMKKFLRNLMGVGLVILGIIGLILPIMPGWIFLIPGLMILAESFPWLDRFLNKWIAWGKEKMAREKKDGVKNDAGPPASAI